MSFWDHYRGRCTGRVIHFLYHYAGIRVAESAQIGKDRVEHHGKPFASYTWSDRFGRCDVPEFTFHDDPHGRLAVAQAGCVEQAIAEGCSSSVPADQRAPVGGDIMRVLARDACRRAELFCESVHGHEPAYYVSGDRLFAESDGWVYAWAPEANNWMLWVEGEKRRTSTG